MRLQIEEHAGDAAAAESSLQAGNGRGEVAQNRPRGRVAEVGRHEVLAARLRRRGRALGRLRMAIVLDVHPAQARLHRQVLLEDFGGEKPCTRMLAASKISTIAGWFTCRWISASSWPVWPTRLASISRPKVRSERWQASAIWPNWSTACGRCSRIGALGLIEREAADQLGLEGVGQLAGLRDVAGQVLLERHETFFVPSSTSSSLTLPIGEPIDETFSPYSSCRWRILDLRLAQLHHVLDAVADVDEAHCVVLKPRAAKAANCCTAVFWLAASSAKPDRITRRFVRHGQTPGI